MQFYPWFAPNYPPPPLPSRESIINEGLRSFEQTKIDQQWVQNWVKVKRSSVKRISLSDYRQKLLAHAQLLRQYQTAINQSNSILLNELKSKIIENDQSLYDPNTVKSIEQAIRRRKSKRARLRRQKQKLSLPIDDTPIEPTRSHSPVTNEKLEDIHSVLRLIEQLQTLRQADSLTELHQRCTAKLLEYENELKTNPSRELANYLFDNQNQSFYQSINPDTQDLLRAHQNKLHLIQTRQVWDQYLTTQRSSIEHMLPMKWNEPQSPCDIHWAKYISNPPTNTDRITT